MKAHEVYTLACVLVGTHPVGVRVREVEAMWRAGLLTEDVDSTRMVVSDMGHAEFDAALATANEKHCSDRAA